MINDRAAHCAAIILLIGLCASCAAPSSQGRGQAGQPFPAANSNQPINRPVATRSTQIRAEIYPRGSVPYDSQTLPLVSPDGRYIATQAGIAPPWPTVLAQASGGVPYATRLEIYSLDLARDGVEFHTAVEGPVLLGRSFNDDGFLIEAPREDGSRWIGMASWDTGEVTWLVADEFVNAFASLGPDGRLAFCRRAVDEPDHLFELVIRHGEREWAMDAEGGAWLMPTWSGRGDGLFALLLHDGFLDAMYAVATDETAFRQSLRGIQLARDCIVHTAYQTIGAQVAGPVNASPTEQFIFHHPVQARMAIWRPSAGASAALTMFDQLSFAAVLDDGDEFALVTTEQHLLRQNVRQLRNRSELIAGVQIPRRVNSPDCRYVLLTPQRDTIGIIAMMPTQ